MVRKLKIGVVVFFVCLLSSFSLVYGNGLKVSGGYVLYFVKYRDVSIGYLEKGEKVKKLQAELVNLGYLPIKDDIDGSYGPKTKEAVSKYQKEHNIEPEETGICDSETLLSLQVDVVSDCILDESYVYEEPEIDWMHVYDMGDMGRLYIPKTGLSVALYGSIYAESNSAYNQWLCDLYDGACYYLDLNIIAEHHNQMFAGLESIEVGDIVYILYPDGSQVNYRCIDRGYGINDGYNIWNQYCINLCEYPGDLTFYTCTYDWVHIFLCQFAPV